MKLLTCRLREQNRHSSEAIGALSWPKPERCHKSTMNKPDIRELIDLWPVYPEVDWLRGICGGIV